MTTWCLRTKTVPISWAPDTTLWMQNLHATPAMTGTHSSLLFSIGSQSKADKSGRNKEPCDYHLLSPTLSEDGTPSHCALPYLPLTISPKAACVLAGAPACRVLGIRICSADLGLAGFQNTGAGEKSDLAVLEHSGTGGWCLGYAKCPLKRSE